MADVVYQHSIRLHESPNSSIPLRTGIPFPTRAVKDESRITLSANGKNVPCQIRPVMHWPDGSVQWALVDWIGQAGLDEYELQTSTRHDATRVSLPQPDLSQPDLSQTNPSFDGTGVFLDEVTASLKGFLSDGRALTLRTEKIEAIDKGPIRNSHRIHGYLADESGQQHTQCIWHVHSFADSPLQRWSLTLRNPQPASHPGGIWELGDPNSILLRSLELEITSHQVDSTAKKAKINNDTDWSSFREHWALSQFGSGGKNHRSQVHRDAKSEVNVPFPGYRLDCDNLVSEGSRSTPSILIGSESAIGFLCDRFWQNFPQRLASRDHTIVWELFPSGVHNHESGHHELQPGEQKTYEFWIAQGEFSNVEASLDQVRRQPHIILDAEKIADSEVIPHFAPESKDPNELYVNLVHQAIDGEDTFFTKREQIDMFGWRNFGELYGDHEAVYSSPEDPLISHYNNQYDAILGLGIHALRSGNSRFRELMEDLARHVIDIDIYHTDQDRGAYNHGQFWHTVHYVDAGTSTHRTYPKGTCGGGPSSGQAYSRGMLLHYCLTGDETAKEAVINMGRWMIAAEDGANTKYRFLAGGETGLTSASGFEFYHGPGRGPANAVEVLVTAFQLTHDRTFLAQAEHLIRRVVHPYQPVEELNLQDVENRWFYTMFLQALGRYLDLKHLMGELDEAYSYGRQVLLKFADWMVENEYAYLDKPEILEYPNETWSAQEMRKCESLQWAIKHGDEDSQNRYLSKAKEFFQVACQQLTVSTRSSLCRPVVLLLSNGYSHCWFQQHESNLPKLPPGPSQSFSDRKTFVDQKQRAISRAKFLVAAAGTVSFAALLVAIAYWTRMFT